MFLVRKWDHVRRILRTDGKTVFDPAQEALALDGLESAQYARIRHVVGAHLAVDHMLSGGGEIHGGGAFVWFRRAELQPVASLRNLGPKAF